ncbi:MAG: PAS domain-containing protein [Acidobacteriia bacterium]|nr:PAS domain-containing protein [Terriglobia bacterium]
MEAFQQLLSSLPTRTGLAFVFVQHLAPKHESMLTELLSRSTKIPVHEVQEGMAVAPDHIYVIPANTNLVISAGVLHLLPRKETELPHMPIDCFLTSLAEDRKGRAIGVILSGTASDGTLGLKAIKAEGGIAFAQDEKTAKYDSMPRSAIAAGVVDFVLPPEGIAKELTRIGRHPYVIQARAAEGDELLVAGDDELNQILTLVRGATGDDFTYYKKSTLKRRIKRRMILHKMEKLAQYVRYLRGNGPELQELYQDFLINVTSFFRDPGVYQAFKKKVFPLLLKSHPADSALRIWVPGCSTGEEAYSLAICALEFLGEAKSNIPIQLFGTDISETAIEKARAGKYAEGIAADVSHERLRRFFLGVPGGYQVSKAIREMCVFARHNLLKDPPFSRMDLVSCRNLLIYLDLGAQKKVIPVLSYALRSPGFLILGTSENITAFSELFSLVDKKSKIYAKKPTGVAHVGMYLPASITLEKAKPGVRGGGEATVAFDVQKEVQRLLLSEYTPAGVVVNSDLNIIQFHGHMGGFLEPAPGQASLNLAKLTQEALSLDLRTIIHAAKKQDAPVVREGVRLKSQGRDRNITLEVVPIKGSSPRDRYFLVLFREEEPLPKKPVVHEARAGKLRRKSEEAETARLTEELDYMRSHVQAILEEQEATNEELRSANEEIQSSNEELQSTNEELETAKEELQSSNEELTTLNEELQNRNTELDALNNDLNNLIDSINVPVVMLSKDLRVRRFTPLAEKVLNLIPTDLGRPITDLKPNIEVPNLEKLVAESIDTVSLKEQDVQDRHGHWYSLRVRPYKTAENVIDGVVMTLMDIDALKAEVNDLRLYAESIVQTVRQPLVVLDGNLRVVTANAVFYETFHVSAEEVQNRFLYTLGNGQWDIPSLRELLERVLPTRTALEGFEVRHEFPAIGQRTMLLNARQIRTRGGAATLILLAMEDITERKKAEQVMRELPARLVESQEEERRRIAWELHDGTGQNIAALALNLGMLKGWGSKLDEKGRTALSDCFNLASHVSDELRDISYILHPPLLDEMGLEQALRWFVDGFARRTGLQVDLEMPSGGLANLPEPARLAAFRLVQEALTNAQRHSGSKTAKVVVSQDGNKINLEVVDEGRGMGPDQKLGLGLLGMRERVAQLGGRLDIVSDGRGTSVKAALPVTPKR